MNGLNVIEDWKGNHKIAFKWIIPNIFCLTFKDKELHSKIFTTLKKENEVHCCKLILNFEHTNLVHSKWVKFYLQFGTRDFYFPNGNRCTTCLSVLDSSNQKRIMIAQKDFYSISNASKYLIGLIEPNMIHHSLETSNLILFFEMEICFKSNEKNLPPDDYKSFILAEKFSDVTLHIGDKIIAAHKSILALKSPVFDAMFSRDMSEANGNKAEIVDIDYDVFVEVLRFIYTGKVEKVSELALEILKAAHFYQINDLITICADSLMLNLNFNNAIEVMNVADKCEVKELTNICLTFIKFHFKDFQNSPELNNLLGPQDHLLLKIINALETE